MKKDKVQHLRNEPKLRFSNFIDCYNTFSINELVDKGIIFKPLDGNHGNIHPKSKDYISNGIPFLMANDIYNGQVDLANCKFISIDLAQNLQKGFSIEGDILLTHKGSIGNVALVPKISTPYVMLTPQVTYYRVRDNTRISSDYLRFYFETPYFKKPLSVISSSGTRPYIGITEQRKLIVKLPMDINEQIKIGNCLSQVNKKIELIDKKLENLKLFKKGLVDNLFNRIINDKNKYSIKDFCIIESSSIDKKTRNNEKKIKLINYMDVYNNEYLDKKKIKNVFVSANDNQIEKCTIKQGDLLITPTSETPDDIGHTSLIIEDLENYVFSYHLMRINFTDIEVLDEYKPLIFTNTLLKKEFYKRATGSTRFTLSMKDFNEIKFYLPTIEIQQQHSKLYTDLSNKIDRCLNELETLKQFKKGLLQQMFI